MRCVVMLQTRWAAWCKAQGIQGGASHLLSTMHSQPTTAVLGSVALLVSSGVWALAVDVRNLATPVSVQGASDMHVLKWGEQGAPDKIALRAHLLQRSSDLSHKIKRVWREGARLANEGSQTESRGRNRESSGAKRRQGAGIANHGGRRKRSGAGWEGTGANTFMRRRAPRGELQAEGPMRAESSAAALVGRRREREKDIWAARSEVGEVAER